MPRKLLCGHSICWQTKSVCLTLFLSSVSIGMYFFSRWVANVFGGLVCDRTFLKDVSEDQGLNRGERQHFLTSTTSNSIYLPDLFLGFANFLPIYAT